MKSANANSSRVSVSSTVSTATSVAVETVLWGWATFYSTSCAVLNT